MTDVLPDREAVLGKVRFEGGIYASLEYGLTEDDLPQDDTELRNAWRQLRQAFAQYNAVADQVQELLQQ